MYNTVFLANYCLNTVYVPQTYGQVFIFVAIIHIVLLFMFQTVDYSWLWIVYLLAWLMG